MTSADTRIAALMAHYERVHAALIAVEREERGGYEGRRLKGRGLFNFRKHAFTERDGGDGADEAGDWPADLALRVMEQAGIMDWAQAELDGEVWP